MPSMRRGAVTSEEENFVIRIVIFALLLRSGSVCVTCLDLIANVFSGGVLIWRTNFVPPHWCVGKTGELYFPASL